MNNLVRSTRVRRFTLAVSSLILAACLIALLTVSQIHASQRHGAVEQVRETGSPKETEAMLDELRKAVARQAELTELFARAESIYRDGKVSYGLGNRNAARTAFAQARQILLDGGEDAFYQANIHTFLLKLHHEIATLTQEEKPCAVVTNRLQVDTHESVETFVRHFQEKGQSLLRTAFKRLGEYETMMRKIFREEGVPDALIYVGLVESAYDPYAQSQAGAKGIWQFVAGTGRRYDLKQIGTLDERHDPVKSTRAAARYLRDLYELFDDWPLALAGYNAGEYRLLSVIKRTGIKDFWEMSTRKLLPQETISYVPAVLAAITIANQKGETLSHEPTQDPRQAPLELELGSCLHSVQALE